MNEPTQVTVARSQLWRSLRRIGLCLAVGIGIYIVYGVYLHTGHLPQVRAYDAAYAEVSVGMRRARVEEIMGHPDEVVHYSDGAERYIYRAYPPIARDDEGLQLWLSTRWIVQMDASDRVTFMSREDDPC